jgi:spore maturation protein CgeB
MGKQTSCLYLVNPKKGFWATPLAEGLEKLGCELLRNQWAPDELTLSRVDFCVVNFNEGARRPFDLWKLKRRLGKNIPIVGIDRDAPWHMGFRRRRLLIFKWLKLLDIYASHTLQPTHRFAPTALYLPNAAYTRDYNVSPEMLLEMRNPDFFEYDVSFVGNMDGQRYPEHRQRAEFFRELAQRLRPTGIKFLFEHTTNVPQAMQAKIVQKSRINLNYRSSADHGREKSWGLPERCYGVPARGGFLLSDERGHAADDFVPGDEWAAFDSLDDCVAKIRFFLSHFEQSRRIAEAAHLRVMRDHTYERRAENLLAAIAQWKERHGKK